MSREDDIARARAEYKARRYGPDWCCPYDSCERIVEDMAHPAPRCRDHGVPMLEIKPPTKRVLMKHTLWPALTFYAEVPK